MRALYYPERIYFAMQALFFALLIIAILAINYGNVQPPRPVTCQMAKVVTSGKVILSNRWCNPHALYFSVWVCPSMEYVYQGEGAFMPDVEMCYMQGHGY